MVKFEVFIEDYEWREFVKNQTTNYELPDGNLADLLLKTFKTAEVRYKRKTNPRIYDSEGEHRFVWMKVGIYLDTEENRAILNDLTRLEKERNALNMRLTELMQKAEKVNVSKLHERTVE